MSQHLNFEEFIKKYFEDYKIDSCNKDTIQKISLWAGLDKKFEDSRKGFHLNKGLLITGNVGTGKTDLFWLLQLYLAKYLKNQYQFTYEVVWKFTAAFNKSGYECLESQDKGNRYYDELCMVDGRNQQPIKEFASHFGSKLLIGEEIIMSRYNVFKGSGYQSHFSTNATPAQILEVYGERAFSRLTEMCNFLHLVGDDRRNTGGPNIYRNINSPQAPKPKEISEEETTDNKKMLDGEYAEFIATGKVSDMATLYYEILKIYGCDIGDDDQMRIYMEMVDRGQGAGSGYQASLRALNIGKSALREDKKAHVWKEAKKLAVKLFFQRLKDNGAKTIFGIVQVSILPDQGRIGMVNALGEKQQIEGYDDSRNPVQRSVANQVK